MKNKQILVIIIMVLPLLLFGCGSASTTEPVSTETYTYVGSVNSTVYHYPSCRSASNIKAENEIWFGTVSEAKSAGYRACHACKPPSD